MAVKTDCITIARALIVVNSDEKELDGHSSHGRQSNQKGHVDCVYCTNTYMLCAVEPRERKLTAFNTQSVADKIVGVHTIRLQVQSLCICTYHGIVCLKRILSA